MLDDTPIILKTVDSYLAEVNSLFRKTYEEGKEGEEALYNKVSSFLLSSFPDGKKRFTKFLRSFPIPVHKFGSKQTNDEEQTIYISYLQAIQTNLMALRKELQAKVPEESLKPEPAYMEESTLHEEPTASCVISGEDLVALREELQAKYSKNTTEKLSEIEKLSQEMTELKRDIQKMKVILIDLGNLLYNK